MSRITFCMVVAKSAKLSESKAPKIGRAIPTGLPFFNLTPR